MTQPTLLRERLKARTCVGVRVGLGDPLVVGLLARAGADFVIVDTEHAAIGAEAVQAMVTTARAVGIGSVVRVGGGERGPLLRALDTGADGVMVPAMESAEQARAVVEVVRYAPEGKRSYDPLGASSDYGHVPPDVYPGYANERLLLCAQVETRLGFSNRVEIASTRGVDLVFAEPVSLGLSLGLSADHPELASAVDDVLGVAGRVGKVAGTVARSEADVRRATGLGVRFLVAGSAAELLLAAAQQGIATLKQALPRPTGPVRPGS